MLITHFCEDLFAHHSLLSTQKTEKKVVVELDGDRDRSRDGKEYFITAQVLFPCKHDYLDKGFEDMFCNTVEDVIKTVVGEKDFLRYD